MIPNINKINQKKIIKILIGDTSIQDVSHHTIKMPHLSGNDIFSLFEEMNLKSNVENGVSRWMVMEDFIKTSIKADCLNRSLTCIFTKIDPSEVDFSLNTPKETLSYIIDVVLNEINKILVNSKIEIKKQNGFIIVISDNSPILDSEKIQQIDLQYVHRLKEKCENDLVSDNYDGVITKSRTMLEEVFIYIIGEEYNERDYRGNIQKLYESVREKCGIRKEGVIKPVDDLISCLNSIVNDIANIRNNYSESHGVGKNRITLTKSEAVLVINSSITIADYFLSIYLDSSLNERIDAKNNYTPSYRLP